MFRRLERETEGAVVISGQGLLWGGLFSHPDLCERKKAMRLMQAHCEDIGVTPYFIHRSYIKLPSVQCAQQHVLAH